MQQVFCLIYLQTNDLREKFKLAIKFSVQSMFFNISKQSFENPGRNPYENQATDNRGTTLLKLFTNR